MLLSLALAASGAAQAADLSGSGIAVWSAKKSDSNSYKPRKHRSGKRGKGGGVTFHDGSAESRSERDRRLMRECKGRSNSGVCEGYTR